MKAVVCEQTGGPEVLEIRERPLPKTGPQDLLVKIHAAGLNPVDYKVRTGQVPHFDPPFVLGWDAAGLVEDVGSKVTDYKVGDSVYYSGDFRSGGSYAEFQTVHQDLVSPMPERLTFQQAASIPLVTITAWEALYEKVDLSPGDQLLVHAGAGGVGSAAIQLARNRGCWVVTTASRPDSIEWVEDLGVDEVINYNEQDVVEAVKRITGGGGVDVALDTVGGKTFFDSLKTLKVRGELVTVVENERSLDPMEPFRRAQSIHFELMTTTTLYHHEWNRHRRILGEINKLIERNKFHPIVGRVFPLDEVHRAHELLESRHATGKLILNIDGR